MLTATAPHVLVAAHLEVFLVAGVLVLALVPFLRPNHPRLAEGPTIGTLLGALAVAV
ncbi:hypothetical protein [Micromonospora sp. NPDC049497]|uniref:hypothetical protein n=1 Tax=Micromonospora sp. NPDC049497 TaxID=3364273 RepID=UPI003790E1CC